MLYTFINIVTFITSDHHSQCIAGKVCHLHRNQHQDYYYSPNIELLHSKARVTLFISHSVCELSVINTGEQHLKKVAIKCTFILITDYLLYTRMVLPIVHARQIDKKRLKRPEVYFQRDWRWVTSSDLIILVSSKIYHKFLIKDLEQWRL